MSQAIKEVTAFAPATVANLGPGFDVLGLALHAPGDTVTARLTHASGVKITKVVGDGGRLPLDAARNSAGIAAHHTLLKAGMPEVGVELTVVKAMPLGSGLGSSAASAAAAAFAVNALVGGPLRRRDLIGPCVEAEAAVSGRHADNVAPALLGGLILVRSLDPLDVVRLPVPEGLTVVVVTPAFELPTREARAALPREVPLASMVQMSANLAAFVSACHAGDLALLARSVHDPIVTPVRAKLIPGGEAVMEAAQAAGALASSISGAGPSIFALCRSERSAHEVAEAMTRAFAKAGLEASSVVSPADCPGARPVS